MSLVAVVDVPGRPVAKQRARMNWGGRPYTPPRTRAYEETVAWACRATRITTGENVRVRIELHSKSVLRGDLDNYTKSILDGMQKGNLLRNDRQVKALSVQTVLGLEEKAVIWIYQM